MDRALIQTAVELVRSTSQFLDGASRQRAAPRSQSAGRRACARLFFAFRVLGAPSTCMPNAKFLRSSIQVRVVGQRQERHLEAGTAPRAPCQSNRRLQHRLQGSPRSEFSDTSKFKPYRLFKLSVLAVPACAKSRWPVQCAQAIRAAPRHCWLTLRSTGHFVAVRVWAKKS